MKKIYINNTKRAIVFGKTVLVPGTNVVDAIDKKAFPLLETLIDEDEIEVSENPASAMKKANTRETVKALEGIAKDDSSTRLTRKWLRRQRPRRKAKRKTQKRKAYKYGSHSRRKNRAGVLPGHEGRRKHAS